MVFRRWIFLGLALAAALPAVGNARTILAAISIGRTIARVNILSAKKPMMRATTAAAPLASRSKFTMWIEDAAFFNKMCSLEKEM